MLLLTLMNLSIIGKAEKQLKKYYEHEIVLSDKTPLYGGSIYKISNSSDFVYIGKSPSKFDDFDYMVLFDETKSIKLVKVLVYRENYGGEVGSRRWLKQWIGISKPKYMVDAISGATISVNSLKMSINNLLKHL